MGFRLRHQSREIALNLGQFRIGRSLICDLPLDDPLVSRTHAVLEVAHDRIELRDLGSRNGVRVNGERVVGSRALASGDRIAIGSHEVVLLEAASELSPAPVQQPTEPIEAFGLMGALADKALALGRPDEAERLLSGHLRQVLQDLRDGYELAPELLNHAARHAVKLASHTSKHVWLDYVFELFTHAQRPCPADVVDELHATMRKQRPADTAALRRYLEVLRANAGQLGPAERFLVGRIEGLGRLVNLK